MNIAFFSECYRPTRNGVVVSIETFARHLRNFGHTVHIHAPRYRGYRDNTANITRIPAVRLPMGPGYPVPIPIGRRITTDFARRNFDIVHTHSVFTLSHVGANLAARFGLPLVTTFHTLLLEYLHYAPLPATVSRPLLTNLIRKYCNQCDLVIVPTQRIRGVLTDLGVCTEIQPLPTGIDVDFMSHGDGVRVRTMLRIPAEHRILLYVGRIAKEKNIEFLLRVMLKTLKGRDDTHFVLVGSGPLMPQCERMVSATDVCGQVHFMGSVSPHEVRDFYAAGDIFVFASLTETQGLVIGEAMAAGLPVVALRASGVSEFISSGEDGFLVDASEDALARTTSALLTNDTLRKSIGGAARRKARQFSAESSARRLESFYQVLIEAKRHARQNDADRLLTPRHQSDA